MTELPNTRIAYLYRDGGNFKARGRVVVAGRVAFRDLEPFLDESRYFVPDLVAFPMLHIEGHARDPELDHDWCELEERDFAATDEAPTHEDEASLLIERFRAAAFRGWIR